MSVYPYSTRSLLAFPERYAYTRFGGEDFLPAWKKSRHAAIATLPKGEIPSPSNAPPQGSLAHLRDYLLWWIGHPPDDENFLSSGMPWVIKRFEVSKKLRKSYHLPQWIRHSPYSCDLELYALFGLALARCQRHLSGPARWIPANALLKVNDILVSEITHLGHAAGWVRLSLEEEQDLLG